MAKCFYITVKSHPHSRPTLVEWGQWPLCEPPEKSLQKRKYFEVKRTTRGFMSKVSAVQTLSSPTRIITCRNLPTTSYTFTVYHVKSPSRLFSVQNFSLPPPPLHLISLAIRLFSRLFFNVQSNVAKSRNGLKMKRAPTLLKLLFRLHR